jgi:hypothetical protein
VLLALAVRETGEFGASPGLLKIVANEFVAARLAGQVAQLVEDEIDLQVKSGLLVMDGQTVRLAKSLRVP